MQHLRAGGEMIRPAGQSSGLCAWGSGSTLLLVLFVCLATAVIVAAVSAATLCAEEGLAEETAGRAALAQSDEGLAEMRDLVAAGSECPTEKLLQEEPCWIEGGLVPLGETGWISQATVRQRSDGSPSTTGAWVERGRDGLDLPLAAVVAESVRAALGRGDDWVGLDPAADTLQASGTGVGALGQPAVCVVESTAQLRLGTDCMLRRLAERWRLDEGWACGLDGEGATAIAESRTLVLHGEPGQRVLLREPLGSARSVGGIGASAAQSGTAEALGSSPGSAVLVVLIGGADLDASGLGDLYGVLVVDNGAARLDGTIMHGAVFATKAVDLGETGEVRFHPQILRWATDRSLERTRLVPGTRTESTD